MSTTFIFPDSLHEMAITRLGIDIHKVTDFLSRKEKEAYRDRITDINLKVKGTSWTMRFCLDGRKSGKCNIDAEMQSWVDAGLVTLYDLAMHFCTTIKPGFSRKPVQMPLFS